MAQVFSYNLKNIDSEGVIYLLACNCKIVAAFKEKPMADKIKEKLDNIINNNNASIEELKNIIKYNHLSEEENSGAELFETINNAIMYLNESNASIG